MFAVFCAVFVNVGQIKEYGVFTKSETYLCTQTKAPNVNTNNTLK